MEWLPLIFAAVAALAAIIAAVGAWRTREAAPPKEVLDRLSAIEQRLVQEMDRLRAAAETSTRDSITASATAQKDLALQLSARVDDSSKAQLVALEQRFAAVTQALNDALSAGRRSQDERLDVLEKSLRDSLTAFQNSLTELQASLLKQLAEQGISQADATAKLREHLAASLDGFSVRLNESLGKFAEAQTQGGAAARKEQGEALTALRKTTEDGREAQGRAFAELRDALTAAMTQLREAQEAAAQRLDSKVSDSLEKIRAENSEKLEKIRGTVEEKLQSTLEARLGESFRIVSERLEKVHAGLGEMQVLATGVGDLKRVLTNVRSRGTFGEVQLAALLEESLIPTQFERNIATKKNSGERVEIAIRLPGRDDDGASVYLPIDAKFPQEDYLRLQEAWDAGDADKLEAARRGLRTRLVLEATGIAEKYLDPPHTTDFAILFIPTEGLFAESLRLPGLLDDLQKRRIMLAGPTTLSAILNSLQMGFRTLAIEKRSSEVWKVLGSVKTEFGKFGAALDQVSKKLSEAQNKIEDVSKRRRAMDRNLRQVEALPEGEALKPLPELDGEDEES